LSTSHKVSNIISRGNQESKDVPLTLFLGTLKTDISAIRLRKEKKIDEVDVTQVQQQATLEGDG